MYPSKAISALSEHCSWDATCGVSCNQTSRLHEKIKKWFKAILTTCNPVCRVRAVAKDDVHVEHLSNPILKSMPQKKHPQICEPALRISIMHRFYFVFRPRRFYKYQSRPMPCQSWSGTSDERVGRIQVFELAICVQWKLWNPGAAAMTILQEPIQRDWVCTQICPCFLCVKLNHE